VTRYRAQGGRCKSPLLRRPLAPDPWAPRPPRSNAPPEAEAALLAPAVTRRLIAEFVRRPASGRPPAPGLDGITVREREVLVLVAHGLSNGEIAAELHLSLATVKSHIGHLLGKLGARDRAQLVVAAYEAGLVQPAGR